MAEVLAKQPRPRGPRLTIVTNAGGPGVLATDALIARRRRARRAVAPRRSRRSNGSSRRTGATATRSTSSATPTPAATRKALEIVGRATRTATACSSSSRPQAMTDPTPHRRAPQALRAGRGQAGPGQLDGRRGRRGRRGDPRTAPASRPSPTPTPPPAPSTTCGATPTTSGASTRPRRCRRAASSPDHGRRRRADRSPARRRRADAARPRSSRSSCSPPTASRPSPRASPATPRQAVARGRGDRLSRSSLKLHSETITHKTDVGGVAARTWPTPTPCARPSARIEAVGDASGPAPGTSRA